MTATSTTAVTADEDDSPDDADVDTAHPLDVDGEFPIEPPRDGRAADVNVTHPLEYESIRDRVRRAREQDDPTEKYGPQLEEETRTGLRCSFRLDVRTYGEPVWIVTERDENRIAGWSPRDDELEYLSKFGEITYVPDFSTTRLSMVDVAEGHLSDVAALPFVLAVDFRPEPVDDPTEDEGEPADSPLDADTIDSPENDDPHNRRRQVRPVEDARFFGGYRKHHADERRRRYGADRSVAP